MRQPATAPAYGATYEAPENQNVFARAWDSITSGAEKTADAGEWLFEETKDGAVVVWDATESVAGEAWDETKEASVHSAVKSRLALNEQVPATDINVDVNDGVVTLTGRVDSAQVAASAVRTALDTTGVHRVVSYLTWPGHEGPARQPVRGEDRPGAFERAREGVEDAAGEAADEAGDAAGETGDTLEDVGEDVVD